MKIIQQKLITGFELFLFRLALHRRERIIQPQYDRQLSQEIDCLQTLIDGGKGQKR